MYNPNIGRSTKIWIFPRWTPWRPPPPPTPTILPIIRTLIALASSHRTPFELKIFEIYCWNIVNRNCSRRFQKLHNFTDSDSAWSLTPLLTYFEKVPDNFKNCRSLRIRNMPTDFVRSSHTCILERSLRISQLESGKSVLYYYQSVRIGQVYRLYTDVQFLFSFVILWRIFNIL